MDASKRGAMATFAQPLRRLDQNGLECLADINGAQSRDRPNLGTDPEDSLGLIPRAVVATRATTTATPNTGMGESAGMRRVGLALRKQPSTCPKPNQNRLQMVQTRINNLDEHNGKSDYAHGPLW